MRRFSCNVSQKKGGFPVQIGVLVQKEKNKQKKATEVSGGFMCLKYKVDKRMTLLLASYLFPKLNKTCPKYFFLKGEEKEKRGGHRYHPCQQAGPGRLLLIRTLRKGHTLLRPQSQFVFQNSVSECCAHSTNKQVLKVNNKHTPSSCKTHIK